VEEMWEAKKKKNQNAHFYKGKGGTLQKRGEGKESKNVFRKGKSPTRKKTSPGIENKKKRA